MSASSAAGWINGVLVFVMLEVFTHRLPQPTGTIIYFALLTAQLTWLAVTWWRRTAMPYMTAGTAVAAAMTAYLSVLAATTEQVFRTRSFFVATAIVVAAFLLTRWLEAKRNPEKWQTLSDYQRRATVWDLLLARLPDLRNARA